MSHFFAIFSIITIRYQTFQRLLRIGQAASKQRLGSSNRIGKYIPQIPHPPHAADFPPHAAYVDISDRISLYIARSHLLMASLG